MPFNPYHIVTIVGQILFEKVLAMVCDWNPPGTFFYEGKEYDMKGYEKLCILKYIAFVVI